MAIECFEIKWTGFFSLDAIKGRTEANDKGIYAVYKGREIYYIGKSTNFGARLNHHRREWTHALGESGVSKLRVCVGVILNYKSTHPSQNITDSQLSALESFLINYKPEKPKGNPPSDKTGYKGKISPVVINTGKIGGLDKVIFHNSTVEKLLKGNLIPKPKKESTYGW